MSMKWLTGQPAKTDDGYYLCAIVNNSQPSELYWDGSSWSYAVEYESKEIVDNNDVPYYMRLDDIPMPEGW
jgi:hypothetical protein